MPIRPSADPRWQHDLPPGRPLARKQEHSARLGPAGPALRQPSPAAPFSVAELLDRLNGDSVWEPLAAHCGTDLPLPAAALWVGLLLAEDGQVAASLGTAVRVARALDGLNEADRALLGVDHLDRAAVRDAASALLDRLARPASTGWGQA